MGADCSKEGGCYEAGPGSIGGPNADGRGGSGHPKSSKASNGTSSASAGGGSGGETKSSESKANPNGFEKREANFAAYASHYNPDGTRRDGKQEGPKYSKQFRILLLGAGESGKTTFTSQLSLLHNLTQLTPEELKRNTLQALHENIVQCISATAANAVRLNLELSPADKERLESIKMSVKLDKVVADDVVQLWNSPAMQESYAHRSKYWILDTAEWLMENVTRFAEDDFMPTKQDIVLSRRRTTGISEHTYIINDTAFTIIDVGGQRSERRKWVQFFADVHCIVFFVSAIGFCKVLFEDSNTYQMKEALELFASTFRVPAPSSGSKIDNDWQDYVFETTPIHLVFNKMDLLDEALKTYQLSACFPSYKGSNSKNSVMRFLAQTFTERIISIRSPPDIHYVSAAREEEVQELFTKLTTFLMEKEKAGIALNAFMAAEKAREEHEAKALTGRRDRDKSRDRGEKEKGRDDANRLAAQAIDAELDRKRQRQRLKRIRELMCET